jgi:hypothetical protein
MMATKSFSKPVKLPSRAVLNALGKSKMTIQDYAKASPSNSVDQLAPALQLLRKGK